MKVLITGGAGYIGSVIAYALADAGHQPIILDEQPVSDNVFFEYFHGDIADTSLLTEIFDMHTDIDLVIHCAAKIDVAESASKPELYYQNNFSKSIVMVDHLLKLGVNKLILSGTASLYNSTIASCFDEQVAPNPISPYAWSKYFLERALNDLSKARHFHFLIFRYFNPIGSDRKARTGFRGNNKSSLLNALIDCSAQNRTFYVNGYDWDTRDGTTIRDFVDVQDLADAHVIASEGLNNQFLKVPVNTFGLPVINLGSEHGVTVNEFVSAFKHVTACNLDVKSVGRRPGDIIGGYASSTIARALLGWQSSTPLETSILNSINWATKCAFRQ